VNATPAAQTEAAPGHPVAARFEEALAAGHCPICACLRRDEFNELCRWVGGNTQDETNRWQLEAAGGFCNHHSWLLMGIHSPRSGSLLNDFMVARLFRELKSTTAPGEHAAAAYLRRARDECPFCAHLATCEACHLDAFVRCVRDADAWRRYAESCGLCVPHFVCCLALEPDVVFQERLKDALEQQFQRLQADMREYVRKFDNGQRWTISRPETNAWVQAAEKLVGRPNIRTPDKLLQKP
jgi:hypothetical protein